MLQPCRCLSARSFACAQPWAARCRQIFSSLSTQPRPFQSSSTSHDDRATHLRKQLKEEAKQQKLIAKTSSFQRHANKPSSGWDLTVGIEIHAQLNTTCKLFSRKSIKHDSVITSECSETRLAYLYLAEGGTAGNGPPNSQIAAFDLSVPGTQPIFQKAALLPAIRAALALECEVQTHSRFDRKHYFYHDQPAGYQITQYYAPLAKNGTVVLGKRDGIDSEGPQPVTIGIKQIQLEQDTAKTQEYDEGQLLVDFNRAGHPLIEIITLPQIHSPITAAAFVRKVQALLLSVDAVTTGMEEGGLRVDVNVSIRPARSSASHHEYSLSGGLGQRTEIKNLGTIKAVELAVTAERDRQISILEQGGTISSETRGWSLSARGETRRLRSKEGEVDYRYMPDPDIPPLMIEPELVQRLSQDLPPLPDELVSMLISDSRYLLSETDAHILAQLDGGARLDYYQDVVAILGTMFIPPATSTSQTKLGQVASNWVLHKLGELMSIHGVPWTENKVTTDSMADIIVSVLGRKVTGKTAQSILNVKFHGDSRKVEQIIQEESLEFRPLSEAEYFDLANAVLDSYPDIVEQIRGNPKNRGKVMFLVGQLIRRGGADRVDARLAEKALQENIARPTQ